MIGKWINTTFKLNLPGKNEISKSKDLKEEKDKGFICRGYFQARGWKKVFN